MGYLSFQIIFFLLLAALLGFIVGWLLRGSRFQTELQDLDGRWRTKLGEVENERDRFVAELTQANDAKAKLEAENERLSETHESSLRQLKSDHQTKIATFADTEKLTAELKLDLTDKSNELGNVQAELAKVQQTGGDAGRLGRELSAATERTTELEDTLKKARTANVNCKSEVDRLNAEIAELKRHDGGAGTASAGGALGLISSTGGSDSDPSFTQQTASPSHLTEAGGQGFGGGGGDTRPASGSASDSSDAGTGNDNEGVRPTALTSAQGGQADDLKRISGVGPKLEKTLNGLGIFHFSQIADFTPDNVAWVDRHLRFKGRIERENWTGQAKTLAAGGETEFSERQ